jgi:hypothetical protein
MRNINDYGYPRDNHVNNRSGNAYGSINKNYNPFDPLMDQNIVCYKCNNLGHKARDCRDMKEDAPMPTTVWKRKENPNKENCRLALIVEDKEDEWYIDSGCSTHMTGDQNKFISLKKGKSGRVAFGNDSSIKILGKGVVSLGSENVKAENVLLVEELKHNLLSVSKICDQGYNLKFDS